MSLLTDDDDDDESDARGQRSKVKMQVLEVFFSISVGFF